MNENAKLEYGDAISAPFWEAAAQQRLVIQHCLECGAYQFYPRPFCLVCSSDDIAWENVRGEATIYSLTTVRVQIAPEFKPPYIVAVVTLAEGPRMLANIEGGHPRIGDKVSIAWRERGNAPPLPVWTIPRL